MSNKMKTVGTLLMAVGFFFVFGAIGGIEAETLSLLEGTIESAVALILIMIGSFLENSSEEREGERE